VIANPIRFLIVDDDEDDQEILSVAITKSIFFNNTCSYAANGEEALSKLHSGLLPDYIFLDLNMPRMNGMQCLGEIRKSAAFKDIPVVIYTTSTDEATKTIAMRQGATAFISKPTRIGDLVICLDSFFTENKPVQVQ
jgi:CheY-like chemotaxis protein